jgi:hypothetical protein
MTDYTTYYENNGQSSQTTADYAAGQLDGGIEYSSSNMPPSWADQNITGPLKNLFKSKYDYNALQYPSDLNSAAKGHSIVFEISELTSVTVNEVIDYGVGVAKNIYQEGKNALETAGNALTTAGQSFVNNPTATVEAGVAAATAGLEKTYNSTADALKNFATNGISINGKTAAEFVQNGKGLATIVTLYMPDSLSFQYSTVYDETTSIASAAASLPGIGKPAGFVQSIFQNEGVKLVLNKMGYAFNPQDQVLFQGVNFRTFEMSFTFSPRSAHETAKVQEIVKTFRKYAAPTIQTAAAGFFYKPPGIFNLSFRKDGAVNPNINKLADCVLTNVTVNYAPNGWSAHTDGQPTQMTMDLSFQETVIIDSAKIDLGY